MISTLVKKEGNVVTLKIEVEAEVFEKGVQEAYQKNRQKFNISGFRKGKAPRKLIEMNYGEGIFYEDAINIVFPEAYDNAIEEHKLDPVDRPSVDVDDIEKGKTVVFTADVTVMPEVKLGEYKGVEIEKADYKVTEEDVEAELKKTQERNARIIDAGDRPVKQGDILTIDYSGFVGDEQFEGGTAQNQTLEIGSGRFIPGFEEQLVGKNKDEEIEVKVTFPEEYHSEDLEGKDAIFKAVIHEIKEKEIPSLDDEFAKDISEFDTLDELKTDIMNKLRKQAEEKEKTENENKVVDKVIELCEVDIPEVMVERQIDDDVNEFAYKLRYQGLEFEKYLELTGTQMEDLREQFRPNAEKFVKADLVLELISEKEAIEATEEELNAELEGFAKSYNQDAEKFKASLKDKDLEYIKKGIIKRKTIEFLLNEAKLS
ncbi:MAG: trigger factor [Tissierellales bacterium]